jgi:hypothetical protein
MLIKSHRTKVDRNNMHRTKRRKTTEIGHILHKITLKRKVIETKMDGSEEMKKKA